MPRPVKQYFIQIKNNVHVNKSGIIPLAVCRLMARISRVCLLVRHVAETVRFLGPGGVNIPILSMCENSTWALLGGEDNSTSIFVRQALEGQESSLSVGYSPLITFEVNNLDELVPNLLQMGAHLDGKIEYLASSKVATLRGPDNHMYVLVEQDESMM